MNKKDVIIIGSILLVLASVHLIFSNHFFNPGFGADQRLYWNQGLFLYKDFHFISNPTFGLYEPYLPLVIFFFLTIFGESYIPIICYNFALYSLLICVVYFFSKDIFEGRLWAILALSLIITNNSYIQFNFLIAREMSTISLLTVCCILTYYYLKNRSIKLLFALSFLSSLLLLNDNRYYPLFFIFVIIWGCFDILLRKKGFSFIIYAAVVSLLLAPWSYRNYKVYGYFLPIAGARIADYLRFVPDKITLGFDTPKLNLLAKNADKASFHGDSSQLRLLPDTLIRGYYMESNKGYHNILTEVEYNILQSEKPKNWFCKRIEYFKSFWTFCQFKTKLGPGDDDRIYPDWSIVRNINEICHTGLLIPFFLIGCLASARNKKIVILFFATVVIFHTLMHVIYGHHLIRYRYQVMPLFTLVSVYGIIIMLKLIRVKLRNLYYFFHERTI